jgi:hypothetical protein
MITTTDAIIITIAFLTIAIITITIITIISISFEYATICPQWVGNTQYILLENLSWRLALPKFQLSTIHRESMASIVNNIVVRECEIVSWGAC